MFQRYAKRRDWLSLKWIFQHSSSHQRFTAVFWLWHNKAKWSVCVLDEPSQCFTACDSRTSHCTVTFTNTAVSNEQHFYEHMNNFCWVSFLPLVSLISICPEVWRWLSNKNLVGCRSGWMDGFTKCVTSTWKAACFLFPNSSQCWFLLTMSMCPHLTVTK